MFWLACGILQGPDAMLALRIVFSAVQIIVYKFMYNDSYNNRLGVNAFESVTLTLTSSTA